MAVSFRFTIPEDEPFLHRSIEPDQRHSDPKSPAGTVPEAIPETGRLACLRQQAACFLASEHTAEALDCIREALAIDPDQPFTLAYYGLALEQRKQNDKAIAIYQQALDQLEQMGQADHPIVAELWYRQGTAWRSQSQYPQAIASYTNAIDLNPNEANALSARGVTYALWGRHKKAKADCTRALALAPDTALVLNNSGIAWMAARRNPLALAQFERVLDLHPTFEKARYNKALVLSRMHRESEALDLLDLLLQPHKTKPHQSPWQASAWLLHAVLNLKHRRFSEAIRSCRYAQQLQPSSYPAALYKVMALIASGQVWGQLRQAQARSELCRDLCTIAAALKYRFLGLIGVVGILVWGQGSTVDLIRQIFPLVLSLLILCLIGVDVWRHRSRLTFVQSVYFGSGWLTYIRAMSTLIVTLFIFTIAYAYAPPVMRWGWANAVFGSPGNIIFQPLNLLQNWSGIGLPTHGWSSITALPTVLSQPSILEGLWACIPALFVAHAVIHPVTLGLLNTHLFHIGAVHITVATLLILLFWLVLLFGVPFWANLEEQIFRQGANTWRSIGVRSVQFGLMHLLAGIPIVGGFVLIVPGFLFAWRYKYVRDRHYHRHQDAMAADTAGVMASTADHAVYNAILMTLAIAAILLEQSSR